jgi:hypothetical protein
MECDDDDCLESLRGENAPLTVVQCRQRRQVPRACRQLTKNRKGPGTETEIRDPREG